MVEPAERIGQRMDPGDRRIGKGQPGKMRAEQHRRARVEIAGLVAGASADWPTAAAAPRPRQSVRQRVLEPRRGIGLDRMDDRVDPGRRGHVRAAGRSSASASSAAQSAISAGELTAGFSPPSQVMTAIGVASDPVPAVVGTSASGSRSPRGQSDPPDRVEIVARAEQIGGELGDIHRAAAAEADDRGDARRPPGLDRGQQGLLRRIGLDRVEQDDSRSLERRSARRRSGRARRRRGR